MRGHRPTTRGSGNSGNNTNTRRRRTLSGGRPLPQTIQNLETIVESPATLNPNTAEWWRRRTSIDSSGEYNITLLLLCMQHGCTYMPY